MAVPKVYRAGKGLVNPKLGDSHFPLDISKKLCVATKYFSETQPAFLLPWERQPN